MGIPTDKRPALEEAINRSFRTIPNPPISDRHRDMPYSQKPSVLNKRPNWTNLLYYILIGIIIYILIKF